jgi:hypothetical protein
MHAQSYTRHLVDYFANQLEAWWLGHVTGLWGGRRAGAALRTTQKVLACDFAPKPHAHDPVTMPCVDAAQIATFILIACNAQKTGSSACFYEIFDTINAVKISSPEVETHMKRA